MLFQQLQQRIPHGEKKDLKIFCKQDILQNGETSIIYNKIIRCQMNGNYYAENKKIEIPADQTLNCFYV